jgi:hypothetical protein
MSNTWPKWVCRESLSHWGCGKWNGREDCDTSWTRLAREPWRLNDAGQTRARSYGIRELGHVGGQYGGSSNQSLKSESGTEFFDAETEGRIPLSSSAETDVETRTNSKSPLFAGQPHGSPAEFDT